MAFASNDGRPDIEPAVFVRASRALWYS